MNGYNNLISENLLNVAQIKTDISRLANAINRKLMDCTEKNPKLTLPVHLQQLQNEWEQDPERHAEAISLAALNGVREILKLLQNQIHRIASCWKTDWSQRLKSALALLLRSKLCNTFSIISFKNALILQQIHMYFLYFILFCIFNLFNLYFMHISIYVIWKECWVNNKLSVRVIGLALMRNQQFW